MNKNGQVKASVRKIVYRKFSDRCAYCGKVLEAINQTVDHIIPYTRGGGDDVNNLFPACKSCNSEKGVKTLDEYREYKTYFNARLLGMYFDCAQLGYLNRLGIVLPDIPKHIFYFEQYEALNNKSNG